MHLPDGAATFRSRRAVARSPRGCAMMPGVRTAMLVLASSGCVTALQVTTTATVADGELAAPFALPAQDGAQVSLAGVLARGPAVLVFYRGYW